MTDTFVHGGTLVYPDRRIRADLRISDGRIAEIGPVASVQVPSDAQRIDGAGRFLMPGLAEMHGHNPAAGSPPELFENVLFLFVANGVTTVRSMLGSAGQLEWREKGRRGEIVAPNLYLAGPSFSGQTVASPQAAIELRSGIRIQAQMLRRMRSQVVRQWFAEAMTVTPWV